MKIRPLTELEPEQLAPLMSSGLLTLYPASRLLASDLPLPTPHMLLQTTDHLRLVCYSHRLSSSFLSEALQSFDEVTEKRSWLRLLRPELSVAESLPLTLVLAVPDTLPGLCLLQHCRPALEVYRFRAVQLGEQTSLFLESLLAPASVDPAQAPRQPSDSVTRHRPAELTAAETSFFNAIKL